VICIVTSVSCWLVNNKQQQICPIQNSRLSLEIQVKHLGAFSLDAFSELLKVTVIFIMSVHLEQLSSHWADLIRFDSVVFFENLFKKYSFIKVVQEWWVLYMKTNIHFWSYLTYFFVERKMFQKKVLEKIETHILCSIAYFWKLCLYETMWKNIVEPGRHQMTVWHMHFACWIRKATNTYWDYVILLFHCNKGCMNAFQC
jgi:hypothetical protein